MAQPHLNPAAVQSCNLSLPQQCLRTRVLLVPQATAPLVRGLALASLSLRAQPAPVSPCASAKADPFGAPVRAESPAVGAQVQRRPDVPSRRLHLRGRHGDRLRGRHRPARRLPGRPRPPGVPCTLTRFPTLCSISPTPTQTVANPPLAFLLVCGTGTPCKHQKSLTAAGSRNRVTRPRNPCTCLNFHLTVRRPPPRTTPARSASSSSSRRSRPSTPSAASPCTRSPRCASPRLTFAFAGQPAWLVGFSGQALRPRPCSLLHLCTTQYGSTLAVMLRCGDERSG